MTEIDYLKLKINDMEKAFDKLHQRHMELLKEQGKLEKENEHLREQMKSSETTMNATSDYNAHLESKITTLEKENGKLFEENEQLKQQMEIEKKWQLEKDKYYVKIKEENEMLKSENKKLQSINDQLEEQLESSGIGIALKMVCENDEI